MKTAKRARIKIDGVYDIECSNWTNFVVGACLSSLGDIEFYSEHQSSESRANGELELALDLVSRGGTWWAHAGGIYDHKWLIDHAAAMDHAIQIGAAGPRIVTAKIDRLNLRDSFALIPCTLKELTTGQGVHKEELDLPCECGENCGGYCSISRTMATHHYKRLVDYLEADCRSLLESLERIQAYADAQDLDMSATVGSSSWKTLKRWLGLPPADLDPNEHTFARGGYYGGRTQNIIPGVHHNVHKHDVCSMYPWTMSTIQMPVGVHHRLYGTDATSAMSAQKPGIYACTIVVPDMHLPPLPYRTDTRIHYPTGLISGKWALPEILYAESIGCNVRAVSECIVWDRQQQLFATYVDKHFELRSQAGKNTPVGLWLKFRLNSPTGKFGSNPDKDHYFVNPSKFVRCPGSDPCDGATGIDCGRCCAIHCNRRCGALTEHSDRIWSQYRYHLDECAHVEWAAYLTSAARVEWHKQAVSVANGLDVIYGDTDSIFSRFRRERRAGSKLGDWEYQGCSDKLVTIAPKAYYTVQNTPEHCKLCDKTHAVQAKAKGAGAPHDAPLKIGHTYGVKGVVGLRLGANLGHLFERKSNVTKGRRIQEGTGDRYRTRDGLTRAPTIVEVLDPQGALDAQFEADYGDDFDSYQDGATNG